MHPLVARLKAHSVTEFGPLFRHPGEELFYVLAGMVELHTEHYRPQILDAGDCAYFDSTMGHACISTGEEDALIFWVSTVPRPNSSSLSPPAVFGSEVEPAPGLLFDPTAEGER
jgi:mannose-6-phosphate isomerase-like protein (cupin superfamily)